MSSTKSVPAGLVTALLAAGLAGANAIDNPRPRPNDDKTQRATPASREVVSWALRQLSDLASDR
jgi:hypothetical protein